MKIGILSGAVKNSGDFLIVKRSERLLKHCFNNAELVRFCRLFPLDEQIAVLNDCDFLVLAGGPAYLQNTYPDNIPFVKDLSKIRVPVYTLGLGWFGKNVLNNTLYESYKFNESTYVFWKWINEYYPLSCRDYYSVKNLKAQSFDNVVMTGCPAWYNIEYLKSVSENRQEKNKTIEKICISDPAYKINFNRGEKVYDTFRRMFPEAKIYFIFHRGIESTEYVSSEKMEATKKYAEMLKVKGAIIKDISCSEQGFEIYDDCDLHLGFRVHAHIYNISRGNCSILIEEDARGTGVNDCLGLPGIRPYDTNNTSDGNVLIDNPKFVEEVKCTIERILSTDKIEIKQAVERIKTYFEVMCNYVKGFNV